MHKERRMCWHFFTLTNFLWPTSKVFSFLDKLYSCSEIRLYYMLTEKVTKDPFNRMEFINPQKNSPKWTRFEFNLSVLYVQKWMDDFESVFLSDLAFSKKINLFHLVLAIKWLAKKFHWTWFVSKPTSIALLVLWTNNSQLLSLRCIHFVPLR